MPRYQAFLLCLLCIFTHANCSTVASLFGKKAIPPAEAQIQDQPPTQYPESNFQWAMQALEAGQYEEALERFNDIAKEKASVQNFHLISYYQGRCLYLLARYKEAAVALRTFLSEGAPSPLTQEARILLLNCYNITRDWDKSLTLAAEAAAQESFEGNKIFINLLWAEALIEKNELVGAKKILREARSIFKALPDGSQIGEVAIENKSNLNERALWLEAHLSMRECASLSPPPPSIPSKKNKVAQDWLIKRGHCLKQASTTALPAYGVLGPRWNRALTESFLEAIEDYKDSASQYIRKYPAVNSKQVQELGRLEIRKYFYQILEDLQLAEKNTSLPRTSPQPHRGLIAKIEQLLQKISIESSSSDRTL